MSLNKELNRTENILSQLAPEVYQENMRFPSVKLSYVITKKRGKLNWSREDLLKKLEEKETPMTSDELARIEGGDPELFPEKFYDVLEALGAKEINYAVSIKFEDEKTTLKV